ncbi:MAG: RNA 2',3'-cyclic phosphodiesterase [Sutterellaceae bacterium]|nr:RNA 2',3'-cyclic phosphodiesterase [Burkholderiaceae bacterium]MDW8429315.1 RNA 2',3'-cyclic phosphodiesterase [Sutterellaceae bacterium]
MNTARNPQSCWRVFVALWPPRSVQRQMFLLGHRLQRYAERARLVPAERLHLTLAFIGTVVPASAVEVARKLRTLDSPPFEWVLDRIGYFAGAQVVWLGGEPIVPLISCAGAVREALQCMNIAFDNRPFVPHVTLLRDVTGWKGDQAAPCTEAIVWRCHRPILVRSEQVAGSFRYVPVTDNPAGISE